LIVNAVWPAMFACLGNATAPPNPDRAVIRCPLGSNTLQTGLSNASRIAFFDFGLAARIQPVGFAPSGFMRYT
jgi:hypothetical protein